MKIVIANKEDLNGGAARAAHRLHTTLLKNGVDSKYLVEKKIRSDKDVLGENSKLFKIYNAAKLAFDPLYLNYNYPNRKMYPWGLNILPTNFHKKINDQKADLVNLHWISNETISWNEMAKIEAPLIWTMHDMWALTGGCHYTYGCEKYLLHCEACPQLESQKAKDISYRIFEKKKELLAKKKMSVVTCSNWLGDCFKNSPLYTSSPIHVLPNPIDTSIFKPIDSFQARNVLNLPQEKNLLLFLAFSASTDSRKGIQFLPEMLQQLEEKYNPNELELVIVGSSSNTSNIQTKFKLNFLGTVHDDWTLALLYSACDVFIAPSTQENLSNAVMESMSCGTPVVAFDIGGMPDMIVHQTNGYLAKPFNPSDLAAGVHTVLGNKHFGQKSREYVLQNFTEEIVFKKAMSIYNQTLA